MTIKVSITANRDLLGQLSFYDFTGLVAAGPYWVLARADRGYAGSQGNPGAMWNLPYGDTPTGTYSVTGIEPTGPGTPRADVNSYGPNGALALIPSAGNALAAAATRKGLLVHGGSIGLGPWLLRPTHGCIRMLDQDLADLIAKINAAGTVFPFDLVVSEDFNGTPPAVVIGDDMNPDDTPDPPPI